MINSTEPTIAATDKQVVITRVFDAPRELVFRAWANPDHLMRWFAPRGCTLHISKMDFRPGGSLLTCISNPKFGDCWCKSVYHEIIVPERIVCTMAIIDAEGNSIEPAAVGHDPEWPRETTLTVTFAEDHGKTKLTLNQTVSESLAKRTGAYPSWIQMLDRLAEELTKTHS